MAKAQQKQGGSGGQQQPRSAISPMRAENYAEWYQSVVREADLAEMAHVRGCMVIKAWGYGLWEQIKARLDVFIRETGHENVYFPMFIPLRYLQKEAEHVEGFAQEMAVVTHHRLEKQNGQLVPAGKLEEPVIVRPTSETIIGESFASWIQSYRDLPVLINQWANVVRWELRPRVFLRTTEFLWQEGHTAHATLDEAMVETLQMHEIYHRFARDWLAIPVIPGEKPPSERFPGAERSFTIEAMMQDGKALQAGTSHYLGQNFAKAAGVEFLDKDGQRKVPHTTSWGVSTRMIGAIIMTHADDDGLRVPPRVAPIHVVVVPVARDEAAAADVLDYCRAVATELRSCKFGPALPVVVKVDERPFRAVEKRWQWIKKGVPVIVEIGPKDIAAGGVTYYARHEANHEAHRTARADLTALLPALLDQIHSSYFQEAADRLQANVRRDIADVAGLVAHFMGDGGGTGPGQRLQGFVAGKWCGEATDEVELRKMAVTIRCLPLEQSGTEGPCIICGKPATTDAILGKSY